MSNKYCAVCGNELHGRQIKYCSKKCMGLGKQNYKTCPVCGKKFKDSESNDTVCCSAKCSKIHRSQLHQSGVYDESIKNMRTGFSKKIDEIGADNHWISKHWVIESPTGEIYECDNLMNFIRKNPDLFDGTPSQAFDGFQKIKATMNGKRRKSPSKSWKGWHLIGYSENNNKYHKSKKKKKGYMHIDYKQYADLSVLTDRESEIFKMRQSGMPCWKIADKCGIKETSVQMSLNKSIKKLNGTFDRDTERKYHRERYQNMTGDRRKKYNEYHREYQKNNRDRINEYQRKRLENIRNNKNNPGE